MNESGASSRTAASAWLGQRLDQALGIVAALDLFAMMMVTFIDVIGRYLFSRPLPGAFELIQIMMAVLIFAGLPLVSAKEEHVTVDIIHAFLARGPRRLLDILVNAVGSVILGVITWRMWIKAGQIAAYNDDTPVLHIPMGPVAYFMCVMSAVTAVVLALNTLRHLRNAPASKD
jgi:TRAP-type C4-dicarboxylate transport system permease small subunit